MLKKWLKIIIISVAIVALIVLVIHVMQRRQEQEQSIGKTFDEIVEDISKTAEDPRSVKAE